MRTAFLIHCFASLLAFVSCDATAQIRTVTPKPDESVVIRTALGIATMIETPTAPVPSIIGDQSGFRVEYLPKGVTIKPLRPGARTNFFLFTDKKRFNLELYTKALEQADRIVYLKDRTVSQSVHWQSFVRSYQADDVALKISRIGLSSQGFLLIDGTLQSQRPQKIKPENVYIFQGKESKVIDSLFLSRVDLEKSRPTVFTIAINKTDLEIKKSLTLEIRLAKRLFLQIPEGLVWK